MYKPLVASYGLIVLVIAVIAVVGQPRIGSHPAGPAARFDTDRAWAHLMNLDRLTREGGGRAVGHRGHEEVVSYIEKTFQQSGFVCRRDRFKDMFGGEMTNVLAELPGRDSEVVVLGAHHDAEGGGPAVVDGLTGVAVLLETARVLRESSLREQGTGVPVRQKGILFASWDGESFGCAGSSHFLQRDGRTAPRVRAALSLDSIGWKDGSPVVHSPRYSDRFGGTHAAPDWLVWSVIRSGRGAGVSAPLGDRYLSLPYQVATRMIDLGYYSDDRPFVLAGIPGVFVADFSLSHFYPHYGSAQDTIEQVDRGSLGSAGRLVTAAVSDLASAESLPAGEPEYLMLPSPLGWVRLTGSEIRMLAPLLLLPGLLGLMRARAGAKGILALGLFIVLATLFLYGVLRIDAVVFGVLGAPVLLAAPLLTLRHEGGLNGFLVSLTPLLLSSMLLLPMLGGAHEGRFMMGGRGSICLVLLAVLGLALACDRLAARRRRSVAGRLAQAEL